MMNRPSMPILHLLVVLLLVALMGGCSASSAGGSYEPPAVTTTPTYPDWNKWTPVTPVPQVQMTESDKNSYRIDYLSHFAEQLGLVNPPVVPLVTYGYPDVIYPDQAACLAAAGFPGVRVMPTLRGLDRASLPSSEAFSEAWYDCTAKYFIDPRFSLPPTDAQLGLIWDYMTTFLIPCLTAHGVASATPPQREEFVKSQGNGWSYPEATSDDIQAQCRGIVPGGPFLGDR